MPPPRCNTAHICIRAQSSQEAETSDKVRLQRVLKLKEGNREAGQKEVADWQWHGQEAGVRMVPQRSSKPKWAQGSVERGKMNVKKGDRNRWCRRQERASQTHCSCASKGCWQSSRAS